MVDRNINDDECCQHCQRICKLLQCGRCRSVSYCSTECQKLDWEVGHRKRCRVLAAAATAKAAAAWEELQELLRGLSLSEADEYYHKATRDVDRLKQQEKQHTAHVFAGDRCESSRTITRPQQVDPVKANENPALDYPLKQADSKTQPKIRTRIMPRRVGYVVEELLNTSCYQLRLTCQPDFPRPQDLQVSTQTLNKRNMVFVLHHKGSTDEVYLCIHLDQISNELKATIGSDSDGHHLNIRIPMVSQQPNDFSVPCSQPLTPATAINTLQCRMCQQLLIKSDSISKTLLLPSGNWDEITDYLSCYSGPSVVDFASESAMARAGVALEDSSVLILHQNDLGDSLCALAVETYGQDSDDFKNEVDFQSADSVLNRGNRKWRNIVSGATLCCSQCCAPLGVASGESPETSRLWKHRLTTNSGDFAQHTVGTFLANEMVRYAESKAVFTFVVVMPSLKQAHVKKLCLLLRLLRWDTRIALSANSTCDEHDVELPQFERVAKVIYEETFEPNATSPSDVTNWNWGGVDLCCTIPEPFAASESPDSNLVSPEQSSVRICLPADEWHELNRSLRDSSKIFSKDVAKATFMIKIGKKLSEGDNAVGLGILPLI